LRGAYRLFAPPWMTLADLVSQSVTNTDSSRSK
jgi:hypothetical protein